MSLVAYSPLAMGRLTGKYDAQHKPKVCVAGWRAGQGGKELAPGKPARLWVLRCAMLRSAHALSCAAVPSIILPCWRWACARREHAGLATMSGIASSPSWTGSKDWARCTAGRHQARWGDGASCWCVLLQCGAQRQACGGNTVLVA